MYRQTRLKHYLPTTSLAVGNKETIWLDYMTTLLYDKIIILHNFCKELRRKDLDRGARVPGTHSPPLDPTLERTGCTSKICLCKSAQVSQNLTPKSCYILFQLIKKQETFPSRAYPESYSTKMLIE